MARDPERLEAARRQVVGAGGRALALVANVTDADALQAAVTRTEAERHPT